MGKHFSWSSATERKVAALYYQNRLTLKQIAVNLGCTYGTIRKKIRRLGLKGRSRQKGSPLSQRQDHGGNGISIPLGGYHSPTVGKRDAYFDERVPQADREKLVAAFIARQGVTKCPPAFVAPSTAKLSPEVNRFHQERYARMYPEATFLFGWVANLGK